MQLRPCDVGRRERGLVLPEADLRGARRDLRHQRVHVSVDFGLFIPIGIDVLVELLPLGNHVHELAVPAVPALVGGEAVEQRLARRFLQIHVERGVNAQPAFVHLVAAILRFQVAADFLDIVRSQRIRIFLQVERDRLALGVRRLGGGDLAVLQHGIEHEVAPLDRAFRMVDRRVILRRLGKSREQRGLFQFQLLGRFAEIVFRSGFKAVGAVAEKNLVGVEREDLRLGEAALDLDGKQRLLHLAIKRAVGREKQIAGELHGERGGSLHFPAGFDIAIRRACDAPEVDARVPVEILVFDRDQRIAQNFGIVVIGGDDAALQREGADDSPLSVIEFGDGTGTVTFELLDLGQVGRVDQQQPGGRAHRGGEQDEQSEQDESHQLPSANFYR